jgi:hypothetical protein
MQEKYGVTSSGMWSHLVWLVDTNILEEPAASMLRIKIKPRGEMVHDRSTIIQMFLEE